MHESAMEALHAENEDGDSPLEMAKAKRGADSAIYKFFEEKHQIRKLAQTNDEEERRKVVEALKEPLLCKITVKDQVGFALLCGHQLCSHCVTKSETRGPYGGLCPVCREPITRKVKLFFRVVHPLVHCALF
ncbi:unnamed protein product [Amoebophrya sp. A25]|nr:unnamed protein product [Amoebophrya sp. A25]|eukprot:GSA25T00024151001.1